MKYQIVLSERAITDLESIGDWCTAQAGAEVAAQYLTRLTEKFMSLEYFPKRGTPRDDLVSGLRTTSFEGTIIIGYRVDSDRVLIERLVHGARDLKALF